MKHIRIAFSAFIIVMLTLSSGHAMLPGEHRLDGVPDPQGALPSNSVIDMIQQDGTLWLGTGRGVAQYYTTGEGWFVQRSGDLIGDGGVSALAVSDTVIWTATAFTEKTSAGMLPAGGGVGFSRDGGETWHWEDQPVDDVDEEDYHPTTTNVQNVTYDIAVSPEAVWITSWGGGLRKKMHDSDIWEVVTPDGQPFHPVSSEHLNHRAFSVAYANDYLFVGTAAGIWRSENEGINFVASRHVEDEVSISGEFVTAMAVQPRLQPNGIENIWAATWKANGIYEYYGVSRTTDNGQSWHVVLSDSSIRQSNGIEWRDPAFGEVVPDDAVYLIDEYGPLHVHNFGFDGGIVYACADDALWRSIDNGATWAPIEEIYDPTIGERLTDIDFFSATEMGDSLWVGTDSGIAVYWYDAGGNTNNWRIIRAHQSAGSAGTPKSYAYPSPFSPKREQRTRFQVPASGPTDVSVNIFNFAMEPVYSSQTVTLPGAGENEMEGYGAIIWDGRDDDGKFVANGVYFYRIDIDGDEHWGKVMVLN